MNAKKKKRAFGHKREGRTKTCEDAAVSTSLYSPSTFLHNCAISNDTLMYSTLSQLKLLDNYFLKARNKKEGEKITC